MKRTIALLSLMLAVSLSCMAQSPEEESQLFGYTRSVSEANVINIGKLGSEVVKRVIVINNDTPKTMKIMGFVLPAGIGAMSMQNEIEDFSKGKVELTIDPSIASKVDGETIIINAVYTDRKGKKEAIQMPYKLDAE